METGQWKQVQFLLLFIKPMMKVTILESDLSNFSTVEITEKCCTLSKHPLNKFFVNAFLMLKWLAICLRELAELSKSENLYDAIYSYICINLKIPTKRAFCMAFWVEKEFNYLKVTFNQFYDIFTYFSPNLYKKSWYYVNPQNTLFPWKIFYLQTFSTTVKLKFLQKSFV